MNEWKEYKWGDLVNLEYGKSLKGYRDNNGPFPVYGTNGLIGSADNPLCNYPSVIIGRKGAYRGVHYSDKPFFVIDTAFYIKPKSENINLKFAYFYLKTVDINSMDSGSAIPSTSREDFYDLPAIIPDLTTQTAIAEILSSLDDKIELNNGINKNLEALAQALFKHWFVDFEFPNDNGQPYKSSGGEMMESEMGLIPKGWSVKKISEISNLKIGRTPPRKEHQWFSRNQDDVKWVSIKDMGISGVYITETSEFLTEEAVAKFNIPQINPDTVILSFKLTIGRLAITTERMLSNEAIAHINLNTSDFYPEFIYLYLKLFNYESLGSTSSIATAVNSKSIQGIPVIFPDIKMLERFKAAICHMFKGILNTTQENKDLKKLRDILLPKLISGELEIKYSEKTMTNV